MIYVRSGATHVWQCIALCGVLLALCFSFACAYVSPGAPSGFVNDFAGVLSVNQKSTLETQLTAFKNETSNEVVVVTVPTIGEDYIEHYSVQLAEEWGVGTKKNDNGVIILLAVADRKVRIEVGYGLEGALPDSVADRIVRDMVPLLKGARYDEAVAQAVQGVIDATKGEYAAQVGSGGAKESAAGVFEVVAVFGVILLQWLASILGRSKEWWPGGVIGFVVGSVIALLNPFGFSLIAYAMIIVFLVVFGSFFDYVVSNTFQHDNRLGVNHPWWIGGGSGSSWGGGSSFGGFGGGSFGGGGASGSW